MKKTTKAKIFLAISAVWFTTMTGQSWRQFNDILENPSAMPTTQAGFLGELAALITIPLLPLIISILYYLKVRKDKVT